MVGRRVIPFGSVVSRITPPGALYTQQQKQAADSITQVLSKELGSQKHPR